MCVYILINMYIYIYMCVQCADLDKSIVDESRVEAPYKLRGSDREDDERRCCLDYIML